MLHPENRSIDIAGARIGSFILIFVFWSFLHDGSRIKTRDRNGACLGVEVQHHCFREGAFEGQNSVQMALIWRKGHIGLAIILFVFFENNKILAADKGA